MEPADFPHPVAGIDGCRFGWVCATFDGATYRASVHADIHAVWKTVKSSQLALIDMPIGLLDAGDEDRACEREARQLLGKRHVCVFTPPLRPALGVSTYEGASAQNKQLSGKALSKQAWAISDKIREVDDFMQRRPEARVILREAHPEILFLTLNDGRPILESKKSKLGRERRLDLLAPHVDAEAVLADVRQGHRKRDVADDDVIDALVNAVGAALCVRYGTTSLPAEPIRDAMGLMMEMVLPAHTGIDFSTTTVQSGNSRTTR
jgi:predicted RNase H-like nuclease